MNKEITCLSYFWKLSTIITKLFSWHFSFFFILAKLKLLKNSVLLLKSHILFFNKKIFYQNKLNIQISFEKWYKFLIFYNNISLEHIL